MAMKKFPPNAAVENAGSERAAGPLIAQRVFGSLLATNRKVMPVVATRLVVKIQV